jgi:hypothetical protein
VTATAGVSSIIVTWQPPTHTTGITGYTATADPGPATCTTTCVIGGTAGTTYTVTLVTHHGDLDSTPSTPSDDVTPTAPVPPAAPPDSWVWRRPATGPLSGKLG